MKIVSIKDSEYDLVFGLNWTSVSGESEKNNTNDCEKIAKKNGANFYIGLSDRIGGPTSWIGLPPGNLRLKKNGKSMISVAAACSIAAMEGVIPRDCIILDSIDNGYVMIVLRDAVPLPGNDIWVSDIQEVNKKINELSELFSQTAMQLIGNWSDETPLGPAIPFSGHQHTVMAIAIAHAEQAGVTFIRTQKTKIIFYSVLAIVAIYSVYYFALKSKPIKIDIASANLKTKANEQAKIIEIIESNRIRLRDIPVIISKIMETPIHANGWKVSSIECKYAIKALEINCDGHWIPIVSSASINDFPAGNKNLSSDVGGASDKPYIIHHMVIPLNANYITNASNNIIEYNNITFLIDNIKSRLLPSCTISFTSPKKVIDSKFNSDYPSSGKWTISGKGFINQYEFNNYDSWLLLENLTITIPSGMEQVSYKASGSYFVK